MLIEERNALIKGALAGLFIVFVVAVVVGFTIPSAKAWYEFGTQGETWCENACRYNHGEMLDFDYAFGGRCGCLIDNTIRDINCGSPPPFDIRACYIVGGE